MNTPRTDEKDKSLRGNFAMCYGVMAEFARGLERELAAAIAARDTARADASEAWNECETARNQRDDAKRERDAARAEIEALKPNAALTGAESVPSNGVVGSTPTTDTERAKWPNCHCNVWGSHWCTEVCEPENEQRKSANVGVDGPTMAGKEA